MARVGVPWIWVGTMEGLLGPCCMHFESVERIRLADVLNVGFERKERSENDFPGFWGVVDRLSGGAN